MVISHVSFNLFMKKVTVSILFVLTLTGLGTMKKTNGLNTSGYIYDQAHYVSTANVHLN